MYTAAVLRLFLEKEISTADEKRRGELVERELLRKRVRCVTPIRVAN